MIGNTEFTERKTVHIYSDSKALVSNLKNGQTAAETTKTEIWSCCKRLSDNYTVSSAYSELQGSNIIAHYNFWIIFGLLAKILGRVVKTAFCMFKRVF